MNYQRVLLSLLSALFLLGGVLPDASADLGRGGIHAPKKNKKKRKSRKKKKRRSRTKPVKYIVVAGDTLISIAKNHGVTVKKLHRWNKIKGNSIRPGQKIIIHTDRHVRQRHKSHHTVKKGETLGSIAKKYKIKTKELMAWNPRVDPRKIRLGTKLRLYLMGPEVRSASMGSANRGKLANGEVMPDGKGYRVRFKKRAYGTNKTIRLLAKCLSDTKAKYPKASDLMIGDISTKNGGYLRPHKSHQSGRDADVSYYIKKKDSAWRFVTATPRSLDVEKTWYLFKKFLDTKEVEYIFVNFPLQKVLYEHARKKGVSKKYLDQVFEYPRRGARGIIRHSRGHDDHFHIRFKCDGGDKNCH